MKTRNVYFYRLCGVHCDAAKDKLKFNYCMEKPKR
jgi:hypothetical protein